MNTQPINGTNLNHNPIVLTGLTDHYDPEVRAMLLAMYSRNAESIVDRLPETGEDIQMTKQKLGKYYVGYSHKSVGQLAVADIYIEGVSLLAAKAIENHPLFNGQECSTRYIDFTNQPTVSANEEISQWQKKWLAFYLKAIPLVQEKIKKEFPFELNQGNFHHKEDIAVQEAKKRTTWENTVKARAFDICRGFLPAGITTNVGFSGTFDTINDHFGEMLKHPCEEMREIATSVLSGLAETYPYASLPAATHARNNAYVTNEFFYQEAIRREEMITVTIAPNSEVDTGFLANRAKFSKLNRVDSNAIQIEMSGYIDFGSFRDLNRHRPGVMNMPVLTANEGFEEFYLENLPVELMTEAEGLIVDYFGWYNTSFQSNSIYDMQYCTPIGFIVQVLYRCDLNQALYICELRTDKTVHSTLRQLVHCWVDYLHQELPFDVKIHADMDVDNFTLKRGEQTFQVT